MYPKTKSEIALASLRKKICLEAHEGEHILHETKLAEEHSMSRTPIRQILQRLAYERLVYTKSGVGTVVTPLLDAERKSNLVTHHGVLQTIKLHQPADLSLSDHSDIVALKSMAESMPKGALDVHYTILERLHGILVGLIGDPLLADTFSASHWRIVRWHMKDVHTNQEKADLDLMQLISSIAGYRPYSALDLLNRTHFNS